MNNFWKNVSWRVQLKKSKQQYESHLLRLNCTKAKEILGWKSILFFNETIKMVIDWYKLFNEEPSKIKKFSLDQIEYYERLLEKRL